MPTDDLAQVRALRDDLRALKAQYPELTTAGAQRRLADYMHIQEESPMPAKGDRTMGEDLKNVSFKVPESALPVIETHLREMQRTQPWQRIGRSDALREIFLRGINSIKNPTPQFPIELHAPQLPLPSRPPVEPAAACGYEPRHQRVDMDPDSQRVDISPAVAGSQDNGPRRRRVASPLDQDVEEMPLTMEPPAVTQASAVPDAQIEDVRPARARRTARPKAAVAATSQATPKPKTTRIPKGR